jgi:hypothetical protein
MLQCGFVRSNFSFAMNPNLALDNSLPGRSAESLRREALFKAMQ